MPQSPSAHPTDPASHAADGEDPFEEATATHSTEPTSADEEQPFPPDDGSED